ncbi:thionin-like protein 2 [Eucalyptus grandis]|uniref:Thionin-like protein n=1 Tax=Eucalyptus globulus TaxID=34317 RepID=A0ABD3J144_EUCGL|nr:thionin-like protein 2 [Eucalyptus grandis]
MDKVKSVLVVCLVLGLFLGQSRAEFQDCYVGCFVACVVTGDNVVKCSLKCLKDCIGLPSHGLTDAEYFCKLGCASSLCINLSSKDDPGEKRVAHCVNSCSKTCANHA